MFLDGRDGKMLAELAAQPFSPHYMDHWDAWYNNKTFTQAFTDSAVEGAKTHELRLEPGK